MVVRQLKSYLDPEYTKLRIGNIRQKIGKGLSEKRERECIESWFKLRWLALPDLVWFFARIKYETSNYRI